MAIIADCINEEIKIGKTSITIKNKETGNTKGIVRNITKFKDMQPNKQMQYFKRIKRLNLWGNKMVNVDNIIIQDENIIVFRNIKTVDFYNKYGFINDAEREKFEKENIFYNDLATKIEVINCYC